MAIKVGPVEYGARTTYSAAGNINEDLSKPFAITRMAVVLFNDIDTTSVTDHNDYYDRIISSLSLAVPGRTFFNFTNMRAAFHSQRFRLGRLSPRRPDPVAGSATADLSYIVYLFHFGVAPEIWNPDKRRWEDNPFDLTAGIPSTNAGELALQGVFGAAAAPGTNVTVTADSRVRYYYWGVQKESGDPYEAYMPRAYPEWSMRTPDISGTSSEFGTVDNVPVGSLLHSMLIMTTNGSNDPRADDVLGSLKLKLPNDGGREIFSTRSWFAGTRLSQLGHFNGVSFDTDPTIDSDHDAGLFWIPVHQYADDPRRGGHPLYGADLRGMGQGDVTLEYGVDDATGVTMPIVYHRYSLNAEHPANKAA